MTWVLSLGRSSFAIAFGVLIGAAAALYGAKSAVNRVVVQDVGEGVVEVEPAGPAVQIVDVSRSALEQVGALDGLVAMLGLHPGERVASIGGAAAGLGSLGAAWLAAEPGDFLDVEVMPGHPGAAPRRVLVLVHP